MDIKYEYEDIKEIIVIGEEKSGKTHYINNLFKTSTNYNNNLISYPLITENDIFNEYWFEDYYVFREIKIWKLNDTILDLKTKFSDLHIDDWMFGDTFVLIFPCDLKLKKYDHYFYFIEVLKLLNVDFMIVISKSFLLSNNYNKKTYLNSFIKFFSVPLKRVFLL